MMGYFYGYPGGMGFGWLTMIISWVLVILIIVWLARLVSGRTNKDSALDIAHERYARGEISKKELAEIKKTLKS
ncbi:MAG: SHOCT domain-containing protein [Patescibacteria group bacterium]|mgnify:FL=1